MALRLGSMEYLLKGKTDLERFRFAKRMGLAGVEVVPTREQLPSDARVKELLEAVKETGVVVASLCLGHHNNGGLASRDGAVRAAAVADLKLAIGWAATLGAKVILVPFFFDGDLRGPTAFDDAVAGFREVCPLAEQKGVSLAFEGTLPAARLKAMAAAVASPAFGVYFDLANVVWVGMDTATEIRALGPLIKQVHMKETRVEPWDVSPGLGRVNYAEAKRALAEIGYPRGDGSGGWLVLETPNGPETVFRRDLAFTRKTFPQVGPGPARRFGEFSHVETIEQLADAFTKAGLNAVQLGGKLLTDLVADGAKAAEYRRVLDQADIACVGLAGYRNLIAPDEAKRIANVEFIKACLKLAPLVGAPVVATEAGTLDPASDWAPHPDNYWDGFKAFLKSADDLFPVAKEAGSVLAIEGYVNNAVQNLNHLQGYLDRAATAGAALHAGLVLDPFNYLSSHLLPVQARHTESLLRTFESKFTIAHLKDVSPEGAEVGTPAPFEGVFDHAPLVRFLREDRPDLPVIAEHLPFEQAPAAIARFRTMLGE